MRALLRACSYGRHLGSSQALAFQARFLADRGLNRKDYTDPGYQASGYINPSWYSSTHEGRFKNPYPRAPLYCGNTIDEEELAKKMKKKKRIGDARKQYEESKAKSGEPEARVYRFNRGESDRRSSDSGEPWEVEDDDLLGQPRNRELPPKVSVLNEDTPELEILQEEEKKKKKKKPPKKKRLFKGRIETDYADFNYSNSGLDEYTNRIKEKEDNKIKELEEFLAMKKAREKKTEGDGDHTI
ncbi:uncharacterized protein LOC112341673 isoform X1 [Selaginella moellendorffii]|uniref:uncharacterized protein LOC112341673 isoform X1 n=1 Tax=Selaginella moellendorffii TaxID=88036 RepID=UPI000D1C85BF|nr:uncharacterized protein LOC112341673 isoform X1 [Selaginella moellendorffii]|eukprot:XP_024518003.1 uncharacterized protein LOC112341673 isoform X1 [Selaginella moellendorffii]